MSVALVAAISAGYSMIGSDKSDVSVNDLTKANVEALADDINYVKPCPEMGWDCTDPELPVVSRRSKNQNQ